MMITGRSGILVQEIEATRSKHTKAGDIFLQISNTRSMEYAFLKKAEARKLAQRLLSLAEDRNDAPDQLLAAYGAA